jgi:hypothetical protein
LAIFTPRNSASPFRYLVHHRRVVSDACAGKRSSRPSRLREHLLGERYPNGHDPTSVGSVELVGIDAFGEDDVPSEASVEAFCEVPILLVDLPLFGPLAPDVEDVVLDLDVEVLELDTRYFGPDHELALFPRHVHGRPPFEELAGDGTVGHQPIEHGLHVALERGDRAEWRPPHDGHDHLLSGADAPLHSPCITPNRPELETKVTSETLNPGRR